MATPSLTAIRASIIALNCFHSLQYRCGAKAANALDAFIAQRPVSCIPISLDQYGRTVATCAVGGVDLGEWLVRNGLALDWPQYSKRKYDAAQRDAEHAGRGMWSGSYVEPWGYTGYVFGRAEARPIVRMTPTLIREDGGELRVQSLFDHHEPSRDRGALSRRQSLRRQPAAYAWRIP